jgi:hypothetical protein
MPELASFLRALQNVVLELMAMLSLLLLLLPTVSKQLVLPAEQVSLRPWLYRPALRAVVQARQRA